MRILATTLLLCTLSCGLTPAVAANSQQDKMKACNATAAQKELTGDARKAYMKECLSASAKPAAVPNKQQAKMKTCNAEATKQKVQGDARKDFMKQCLGGQAEHQAN